MELLVALSILALGSLFFLHASTFAVDLSHRSRRATEALGLAQEALERLVAGGWEGVTAECLPEPESAPEGESFSRCRREVMRKGRRYLLLLERTEVERLLERLSVECRWSNDGPFENHRGVRLETLKRRVP